ncbi:MAG: TIGR01906 family membrane protein [Mogibacterium sp.]|nr:TIGR01906 family membrane protein [Mogibacterium sp.]
MQKIHGSEKTHRICAFVCGLCLLFVLLTTSVQAVCFWIPNWWRNEYAKYDTPSNVNGEMSLDDAVHVTEDMLDYCIGRIDTLDDTEATIDGVTAPFFTDREKAHLADCRELFMAGMRARVIALFILIVFSIYIYMHNGKEKTLRIMARGYLQSFAAVIIAGAVIALLALKDFTFVFTEFHHLFFDNDLWILYPDKDNLINIMQEDVFADAAMWIGCIFATVSVILALISGAILKKGRDADTVSHTA